MGAFNVDSMHSTLRAAERDIVNSAILDVYLVSKKNQTFSAGEVSDLEILESQMRIHGARRSGTIHTIHFNAVFGGSSPIEDEIVRSEERRVGKECRSRWSPYH